MKNHRSLLHSSSSLALSPLKTVPEPPEIILCLLFFLTWKANSISTIPPGRALCR